MNDSQLIQELIQAAYDSGYYSGKREDGQPHHLALIEKRGQLRDATLQRLADLRAALEATLKELEIHHGNVEESECCPACKAIQQARAALAGARGGEAGG